MLNTNEGYAPSNQYEPSQKNTLNNYLIELLESGVPPTKIKYKAFSWAKENETQLPTDWDYPIRERLANKRGKLDRDEINFLISVPKKVQFVKNPSANDIKNAIDDSESRDWTVRLRAIHRLGQYKDGLVSKPLQKRAKFDMCKYCRDAAILYCNMRRIGPPKGFKFPPNYRHLKQSKYMKIIERELIGTSTYFKRKEVVPTIEQIISHFKQYNSNLYYMIEGSTYSAGIPDQMQKWFANKCDKLKIKYRIPEQANQTQIGA